MEYHSGQFVDLSTGDWILTPDEAEALGKRGQYFAAGFMRGGNISLPVRQANGLVNMLLGGGLPAYNGESLYPASPDLTIAPQPQIIGFHYVSTNVGSPGVAREMAEDATSDVERSAFLKLADLCSIYPTGSGYTHSIINYGRALAEGLSAYGERVRQRLTASREPEKVELYRGLLILVEGIGRLQARCAEYLASRKFSDDVKERNRQRLLHVYASGLPMHPASGFFDAMVATSFLFMLDGCDNLGRFDQYMWPYYRGDVESGRTNRDEALDLVRTLWGYVDACTGWNTAIGGSTSDGSDAGNELTLVCMEAARGRRRPNLALRLREASPERVWDAAIDTIAAGTGLPALYCEENYLRAMDVAQLNLPDDDKRNFAFGGCTELMIHGCSCVGSLDGDFSVIKTLENALHDRLAGCETFDEFLAGFEADLREGIAHLTDLVNQGQEMRGMYEPQLIRTLLTDDCIDRGKSFYDGGARYNWSVINIVGLSNAVDSLAAVRKCVFEDRRAGADELLTALRANFNGYEQLRAYLQKCPRFGNDDPAVDALAHRLSGFVYKEFKRYAPWRGGKFICGVLMFVTYGWFGEPVGATPDGRLAGTPVGDSAGPVQGRDTHGPTAMLRSVSALQQVHAPGTLVVNIRVAREMVATGEGREKLKTLIRTYFKLGGMQLQVNVVDQAILRDAIKHPERHQDLIIRIGGYSEYFNNLTPELKLSVLERTEHR